MAKTFLNPILVIWADVQVNSTTQQTERNQNKPVYSVYKKKDQKS